MIGQLRLAHVPRYAHDANSIPDDARARRLAEVGWTELQARRPHPDLDHDQDHHHDETTDINPIDDHHPREIRASHPLCLRSQPPVGHRLCHEYARHTPPVTILHDMAMDQDAMVPPATSHHHAVPLPSVLCPAVQGLATANSTPRPRDRVVCPTQPALRTRHPVHAVMCRPAVADSNHAVAAVAGRSHLHAQDHHQALPRRSARPASPRARAASPSAARAAHPRRRRGDRSTRPQGPLPSMAAARVRRSRRASCRRCPR